MIDVPSVDDQIRNLVSATIKSFCKNVAKDCRSVIAERMTALGAKMSVSRLNSYTRTDGKGQRIPVAAVPAFCETTGDYRLVEFLLSPNLRDCLEIGKAVWERHERESIGKSKHTAGRRSSQKSNVAQYLQSDSSCR
jgi:hypothetical protein